MDEAPRRQGVHSSADKQRWTDIYARVRALGGSAEAAAREADRQMLMERKVGEHPVLAAPYGKRT